MTKKSLKLIAISLLIMLVTGCSTYGLHSPGLQRGQYYFNSGFYKRAMQQLMPLAIEGEPQAQYAVGYMYYYGYGVTQDLEVGYLWIQRAAKSNFAPAITALHLLSQQERRLNPPQIKTVNVSLTSPSTPEVKPRP